MAVMPIAFLRLRFWTNYLRNVAIMNIGSVPKLHRKQSIGRPGNAQPTIGSGNIWYNKRFYYQAKQTNQKFAYNLLDFI
jgi:hypothetical protein